MNLRKIFATLKAWLATPNGRIYQQDAVLALTAGFTFWQASGESYTWAAVGAAGALAARTFLRLAIPVPVLVNGADAQHFLVTVDDSNAAHVYVGGREVVTGALARQSGNRGRLPKKPVGKRFDIAWLHEYLHNPLPAVTYPVDVSGGITAWGMDGNGPDPTCTTHPDGVGDCSFAGLNHYKMAKAVAAMLNETPETANQIVALYFEYTGGKDVGANLADLLLWLYKKGYIEAFAPVDHTNPTAVDSAMALFRGVYCGVNLTDDADQLFTEGKPWTVAQGQRPDVDDGHCIVKVKATKAADEFVTWAANQAATKGWTKACLDEAWVIIMPEDAHLVDLPALKADIEALHGTG